MIKYAQGKQGSRGLFQIQIKEFTVYSQAVMMNRSLAAGSVRLFFSYSSSTFLKHPPPPPQEPSNGCVGLSPLCLSCPGMFTVVAGHQAAFISFHVENTASGTEDPPACVDCQSPFLPFGVKTSEGTV